MEEPPLKEGGIQNTARLALRICYALRLHPRGVPLFSRSPFVGRVPVATCSGFELRPQTFTLLSELQISFTSPFPSFAGPYCAHSSRFRYRFRSS